MMNQRLFPNIIPGPLPSYQITSLHLLQVNCYKSKVTISWPIQLLDSLYVEDVYFADAPDPDVCGLQSVGSRGTLLSGYDECGHTAEHTEFSSLYRANIAVVLNDGRSSQVSLLFVFMF